MEIDEHVILGDNASLKIVRLYRAVGNRCKYQEIGYLHRSEGSVLWNNVTIVTEARLNEDVIGSSTKINYRTVVQVVAVIAEDNTYYRLYNVVIRTNLRIWAAL